VVREVQEETGLVVRAARRLGVYFVPGKHEIVFNFLCLRKGGELLAASEADQHAWFPHHSLPANTLARHVERIADAFAWRGHARGGSRSRCAAAWRRTVALRPIPLRRRLRSR
jgi:ADP-ribose pyrophosphatase YjhB (NUDIX family)